MMLLMQGLLGLIRSLFLIHYIEWQCDLAMAPFLHNLPHNLCCIWTPPDNDRTSSYSTCHVCFFSNFQGHPQGTTSNSVFILLTAPEECLRLMAAVVVRMKPRRLMVIDGTICSLCCVMQSHTTLNSHASCSTSLT